MADHHVGRDRGGILAAFDALATADTGLTGLGIEARHPVRPGAGARSSRPPRPRGSTRATARSSQTKGHDAFLIEWDQLTRVLRAAPGGRPRTGRPPGLRRRRGGGGLGRRGVSDAAAPIRAMRCPWTLGLVSGGRPTGASPAGGVAGGEVVGVASGARRLGRRRLLGGCGFLVGSGVEPVVGVGVSTGAGGGVSDGPGVSPGEAVAAGGEGLGVDAGARPVTTVVRSSRSPTIER